MESQELSQSGSIKPLNIEAEELEQQPEIRESGQMHGRGSVDHLPAHEQPLPGAVFREHANPGPGAAPPKAQQRLELSDLNILSGPDPRKSNLVRKGVIGGIVRLAARMLGQGHRIDAKKGEVREYVEADLQRTQQHIVEHSDVSKAASGASQYQSIGTEAPILPKGRGIDSYVTEFADRKNLDKTTVAQAHVNSGVYHGNITDLKSGDGSSWHALSITTDDAGKTVVEHNSVVPTSERALGLSKDLNNVYVRINDQGQITITTGIIDSEKRADEFMAAIAEAIKMRAAQGHEGPVKLRISSHSLNAFGRAGVGEAGMIKRQNAMADYIDRKLEGVLREAGIQNAQMPQGPVMSHVNRTLNGFTALPGEEGKCHSLNRQGMATQMRWLHEDIAEQLPENSNHLSVENYKAAQDNVGNTLAEVRQLKADIANIESIYQASPQVHALNDTLTDLLTRREDLAEQIRKLPEDPAAREVRQLKKAVKKLDKDIKKTQGEIAAREDKDIALVVRQHKARLASSQKALSSQLKTLARSMHQLETSGVALPDDVRNRLQIGGHVLAQQTGLGKELGYPKLKPAQEVQMMILLDRVNGATTQSNCKSSLDRNSHARASGPVIDQHIAAHGIKGTYDFIAGFENRVTDMDREFRAYQKANPEGSFQQWLEGDAGRGYKDIADFQSKMFAEMIGVCRPITAWSTGTDGGFKWHHDKKTLNPLEKNNHPMPYIPVQVYDSDSKRMVSLVRIDSKGNRSFTSEGLALYAGQSQKRGA